MKNEGHCRDTNVMLSRRYELAVAIWLEPREVTINCGAMLRPGRPRTQTPVAAVSVNIAVCSEPAMPLGLHDSINISSISSPNISLMRSYSGSNLSRAPARQTYALRGHGMLREVKVLAVFGVSFARNICWHTAGSQSRRRFSLLSQLFKHCTTSLTRGLALSAQGWLGWVLIVSCLQHRLRLMLGTPVLRNCMFTPMVCPPARAVLPALALKEGSLVGHYCLEGSH